MAEDAIWIPVLPSFKDFASKQDAGLKQATASGKATMQKAGEDAGKAYADGIARAQKDVDRAAGALARSREREAAAAGKVEQASRQLEQARSREMDAAGKVRVAETQLSTLRGRGVTDAGRLAAAEEKVSSAKRGVTTAASNAAAAEQKVATATRASESAARSTASATSTLQNAKAGLARASDQAAGAQERNATAARTGSAAMRDSAGSAGFLAGKLGSMAKMAGGAAIAFAGFNGVKSVLSSGWDRLTSIDNARGKLTALGNDAKKTESIMDSAMESVKGTSYGFGDAATIAAGAVAAGVKPGKELTQYLSRIGDASAIAGVGLSEMGQILNKVQTGQSAYAAELNQLADRGIPIYQWIAKEANVSATEVKKMASEGKVSAEIYFAAIDKNIGGAAKKMDTVSAGASNAKAALSRFGAELMKPAFTGAPVVLSGFTKAVDVLTDGVKVLYSVMGELVNDVMTKLGAGGGADSMQRLGDLFERLRQLALDLAEPVKDIVRSLIEASASVGFSVWELFLTTLEALAPLLVQIITPTIQLLAGFMRENQWAVNAAVIAWSIYRGVMIGAAVAQWAMNSAMLANPMTWIVIAIVAVIGVVVLLWNKVDWFRNGLTAAWEAIKTATSAVWGWLTDNVFPIFMDVLRAVGDVALWLWNNAILPAWAGIKAAVSVAWSFLSPIFDLLGAAFRMIGDIAVWLWQNVMLPAWSAIGQIISVVTIPIQLVIAALIVVFQNLGNIAMWLWNNAIVPAFSGIKAAISVAWSLVSPILNLLKAAFQLVGQMATWLWSNAIVPAFNGVSSAIGAVWSFVSPIFDTFMLGLRTIGDAATWLWNNAIVPAFEGIKSVIETVWNFVKPIFDKIGDAFKTIGEIGKSVGSGIKDAFSGVVDVIKTPVRFVGNLLTKIPAKVGPFDIPGLSTLHSWGESMQNLRDGGKVAGRRKDGRLFGPGTERSDSILGVGLDGMPTAMVSRDEYVVNAASARRFLPLINAINAGDLNALRAMGLTALADGGLVSADDLAKFAQGVEGKPYVWGGTNWGDCSGAVSAVANFAVGEDPFASRFATGSEQEELAKRGFKPGLGPAGSLNIGWFNGGPYGGHTAATLPNGVNFEMGGGRGDGQYGGPAAGADDSQFTDHAHLPPEHFGGLDAGSRTTGSLTGPSQPSMSSTSGGGGGGGANIGGGTGSFGNSGGASKYNTAAEAEKHGVVPVWVENWPASSGGSSTADTTGATTTTPGGSTPGAGGTDGATTTTPGATSGVASTGDATKDAVKRAFSEHNAAWGDGQFWSDAEWIIDKESSWNPTAQNPESGAWGLFQFLGSTKDQYYPGTDPDPYKQGQAGAKYIADRYGDPSKARAFWEANGWYDQGGIAKNKGLLLKNVNQPERVLSPEQTKAFDKLVEWLTGVDMDALREARKTPYAGPEGSWFEDPQAAGLDALFEVLDIGDMVSAEDVLPDKVTRYGVGGPAHSEPVKNGENPDAAGGEGQKVVGTEVHGDVHVTDYEAFTKRQEDDQKNALVKAGM